MPDVMASHEDTVSFIFSSNGTSAIRSLLNESATSVIGAAKCLVHGSSDVMAISIVIPSKGGTSK